MNQRVPIEGRGDNEGRRREREEAARNDAEPPTVQQRVENNKQPQWTILSSVEAVLLNGLPHPGNMSVNDFLRFNLLEDIDLDQRLLRASMFAFVQRCEEYINDVNTLNRIFATIAYKVYKRFVSIYGFYEDEGILNLRRWQQANEEVKARLHVNIRGLRNGDQTWIIVTNMLNDALKEALGEAAQTAGGAVELSGLYDSIYNAKWSCVMSGYGAEPFGMYVFNGIPQRIWTEAEVDITPDPANVDAEIEERPYGLEIFVLTSEKGWPYNRFEMDYTTGCKAAFQHVYIRREIMRVWYIIQRGLQTWWVEKTAHRPPIHIVIGTAGIGKSCGVGSFLLHSLLHFHEGMLDVVAYFTGGIAFLIYNRKGDEGGRVERYEDSRAAVNAMNKMKFENGGHIIMDTRYATQQLYTHLPSYTWGVTFLTFPNSARFDDWTTNRGGRQIIINCDDVRDMKAFVAWKKLSVASCYAILDKESQVRIVEEIKNEWKTIEGRVDVVGPVPRCVYDSMEYTKRVSQAKKTITAINDDNKRHYEDITMKIAGWQNDKVTHRLVRIVRVRDAGESIDGYRCRPLSACIGNAIFLKLLSIIVQKTAIRQVTISDESAAANVFKSGALFAFLFPRVFKVIRDNIKYLRRPGGPEEKRCILKDMTPQQLRLTGEKFLPDARQQPIEKCEYMVLYRPATVNEPVVDGFFFVEGRFRKSPKGRAALTTPNIAVLLQVTKLACHPTTASKVQKFRENMARYFSDWGAFSSNMVWEMIYINGASGGVITRWQRCNGDDPAEAADMWRNMTQYQVTLREEMQGQLMRAYRDEGWYRDAPLLAMEPAPQPRNEQAGAQGG